MKQFYKDISNEKAFEEKMHTLVKKEFEDKFENILLHKEKEFMNSLTAGVCIDLEDIYSAEVLGEKTVQDLLKKYSTLIKDTLYITNFISLNKAWNDYLAKPNEFISLSHYRKHCRYTSAFAKHSCDGCFIQVNDTKDAAVVKYVICIECKKCYQHDSILMYCNKCDLNYYSNTIPVNESIDFLQATWDKYHCTTMKSERMRCIKCKEIFYYDVKEDKLICLGCKFKIAPLEIYWKCVVCSSEFNTGARPYNPMEYKFCKQAIRQALFLKQRAQPYNVPCCNVPIYSTIFFHKSECRGELYQGEYDKKTIVVCSKCKTMNFYELFLWTCPKCFKRFKQKVEDDTNLELNKGFKVNSYEKSGNKDNLTPDPRRQPSKSFSIQDEQRSPNHLVSKVSSTSASSFAIDEEPSGHLEHKKEGKLRSLIEILDERKKMNSKTPQQISETPVKLDYTESNFLKKLDNTPGTDQKEEPSSLNEFNKLNKGYKETSNKQDAKMQVSFTEGNQNIVNVVKRYVRNEVGDNKVTNPIENKLKEFYIQKEPIKEHIIRFDKQTPRIISRSPDYKIIRQVETGERRLLEHSPTPAVRLIKHISDNNNGIRQSSNEKNIIYKDIKLVNIPDQREQRPHTESSIKPIEHVPQVSRLNKFNTDDYKILKQIGEGSYGKIYLVEDKMKNKYAMKKIIAHSGYELTTFKQEFQLVHEARHEGIMKLYGIASSQLDSTTFSLYILMELAQYDWDHEIKTRLRERRPYTEDELKNLIKQLINCLAWLQKRNISHRDLKPQNVLYFGKGVYKLADFGEAKEVKINKQMQLNTIRGTELYMSPILFDSLKQQKDDTIHNCFKSDVFSLGYCIIYAACLTFNCLHEIRELNNMSAISNIISKYLKNKYSPVFIDLIIKMIDTDEKRRFDFIELETYINKQF
jgi:hypothetical protein